MASSRWKRFAFFERNNLSLPAPVQSDVLPSHLFPVEGGAQGKQKSRASTPSSSAGGSGAPSSLNGDNISLVVVNGAGIPFASIPESNQSHSQGYGVHGMTQTLKAISSREGEQFQLENNDGNGKDGDTQKNNGGIGNDPSAAASSQLFQFSSSGQTLSVPTQRKTGNVDGSLVLAFLSSKATRHVHCIDLTVRCNPLNKSKKNSGDLQSASGYGGSGGSSVAGGSGVNNSNAAGSLSVGWKVLEDMDGWRGFFRPFAHDYTDEGETTTATTAATTATTSGGISSGTPASSSLTAVSSPTSSGARTGAGNETKVVSVAVCSDHESDQIKTGKNIYVACVTDDLQSVGITVHRNPHLYLNDVSGLDRSCSIKPKVTPKVECYQPFGKFDHKNRGRPLCVDVKTGLVAVGTDTGMVILYSFRTQNNNSQQVLGGWNGTNKLIVSMEISPPHSINDDVDANANAGAQSTGADEGNKLQVCTYAASCVKLVCEKSGDIPSSNNSSDTKKRGSKSTATSSGKNIKLFVTYRRSRSKAVVSKQSESSSSSSSKAANSSSSGAKSGGGVCCYDLGSLDAILPSNGPVSPTARYDLDARELSSSCLCDIIVGKKGTGMASAGASDPASSTTNANTAIGDMTYDGDKLTIARSDGLYTYSYTEKISVSPIDGSKIAMCSLPPTPVLRRQFHPQRIFHNQTMSIVGDGSGESKTDAAQIDESIMNMVPPESGASYVLIATTDSKSGRDAVDIYDSSNKLVAFHLLLSPGHQALRSIGITTTPKAIMDGNTRGGLSSAIVVTSGGSLVTMTEKVTSDKVSLLVQKNLYAAAISMAFADPSYQSSDITALFRRHAEHLYRKGDFSAAMDQYIYTIGSLEPSHVIFRFLDAPKIPLLTKYLEELRSRGIATSVHSELLKTCYMKLNDVSMADKVSASLTKSMTPNTCNSLVSNLLNQPVEALATICSFDAPNAVEALKSHGAILAKALPKETAGLVISLCDGVYSSSTTAGENSSSKLSRLERHRSGGDALAESLASSNTRPRICEMYPVHLFSSAFLENPKLLRVILSHCQKNKRVIIPSLKRMLLELTLEEWNNAKRLKDVETESNMRTEAIGMLSDPNSATELGNYEALVIVQQQDFTEGMVMLYEKLQMVSSSIEAYAEDGSYKARRQMLAMCKSDPELLADVLGYFVNMAAGKIALDDDESSINSDSEIGELLDDIKEALSMAKSQDTLPPVRVARILAGDGVGQFSEERRRVKSDEYSVPLSVALDYIGAVMDESSKEIDRLKDNVEEYNRMCNSMEDEINELLSFQTSDKSSESNGINIDEMYTKLLESPPDKSSERKSETVSESFWREMAHSPDRFETIARFYAKDVLD